VQCVFLDKYSCRCCDFDSEQNSDRHHVYIFQFLFCLVRMFNHNIHLDKQHDTLHVIRLLRPRFPRSWLQNIMMNALVK